MPRRMARGGKTIYGARVGILMLDTVLPRIPGDIGNASTWPFPVMFKIVRSATSQRVHQRAEGLLALFLAAATELVEDGADGITTSCGYLSLFQSRLAAHCQVPVAASSLMQIPIIERLLPAGRRAGVMTLSTAVLGAHHLEAAGAAPDTPVVGIEDGDEIWRVVENREMEMDVGAAEGDVLNAGEALVSRYPDVGAVVLECTNLTPFARALSEHIRLPVFDMYSFVTWFHAGLAPRDFGHPGSGRRVPM